MIGATISQDPAAPQDLLGFGSPSPNRSSNPAH